MYGVVEGQVEVQLHDMDLANERGRSLDTGKLRENGN